VRRAALDERERLEGMMKMWLRQVEAEARRTGTPLMRDEKTGDPYFVDQRELRLRYLIPIKRIEPFFEGLSKGEVWTTRCRRCGEQYFPPQADCPRCGGSDMEWFKLEGDGTLLTYTRISIKPTSFSHYQDYIVGIARMKEGVSVLAWVKSMDQERIKVGMPIRLTTERREPEGYITYVLVPKE